MLRRLISRGIVMGKGKKISTEAPKPVVAEEKAISCNKSGQIVLRIHAKPGAKLSCVTDVGESEIGVAIGAPPRDGQANEELLDYIGKLIGLRKSELDFDKGAKSRSKILLITSERVTLAQVEQKLREATSQ